MGNRAGRVLSPPRLTARLAVAATLAGAFGMACDVHTPTAPGTLASIVVTPNVTLAINATQQFIAVGKDAAGVVVAISPVWSIEQGGGAINTTGLFTAGTTPGAFTSTVKASSGGISGTASVTVIIGTLATITVSPTPVTLPISGTQQYTAVGKDAGGNVVAISPVWSVVAGGGAISSAALFTAGTVPGNYPNTVQATSGAITGNATVIVTSGSLATIAVTPNPVTLPINGTQQYTAVGKDAGGNVITITPVWSVVASGGAINGTGLFTAGAVLGTFPNTIKASSGTISGTATVTVSVGPLATITVTPNPDTVASNGTAQFTAVGKDAGNNVLVISPVWSVVAGGGAINGTGLFTAGAVAGTFTNTVKAASGAISGTATVEVTVSTLVPLGAAALNGIMAGTQVTCITGGIINADVAISPGNTITGFGPCVITGVQHLADAVALNGQNDLTTAYNTLAGLPCPPANLIVADLGGTTKTAGVYCTAIGIGVTGPLTLDGGGDPNANFVFQAGSSLVTAGDVILIGGAQAKNVYWQVGSSATLGTASQWQGNILALSSITLVDNATLKGRALARNGGVSLGTNNIIILP
jgi:hypothetical protein